MLRDGARRETWRKAIAGWHPTAYIGLLATEPKPPLETPCIYVCEMDAASGLCIGCGRMLDEIAPWAAMSAEERRAIMAVLPARMALFETVKG